MALIKLVSLLILIGVTSSAPIYPVPLTYVALSPIPENIYNQVQDTKSGEYAFGYAGGPVAREESRTSDGVTRGAYSYVDAHGTVQYYRYIADDDGFRVLGTNIPTDMSSSPQLVLEAVKNEPADAENLPEKNTEAASSRKKRSAIYGDVPVVNALSATPLTVVGAAFVPTATSSQSRVEIHNNAKTEIQRPVEAIPVETVAAAPVAVPVAVKNIEASPVAVAASVPLATSSQSRFQIHNSLKTEIHDPIETIPVETVAAAPVAVPVAVKSIEANPVAVAASVPLATSSQSRFQIHNSLKTEIHDPNEAIPVETVAAAPVAVPVAVKSIESIPVPVAASVPLATSSQSRFQIHNSLKTEIHDPIETIPVETVAAAPVAVPVAVKSIESIPVPAAASVPAVAASVPISTSSQHRFQIHSGLKTEIHEPLVAIPIAAETKILHRAPLVAAIRADTGTIAAIPAALPTSVATSTSNQRHFQIHSGAKVEFEALPQSLEQQVVNLQPVISLQPANSFSHPSLARHQIGVGLGVLPSPILAYNNYETVLFAEA